MLAALPCSAVAMYSSILYISILSKYRHASVKPLLNSITSVAQNLTQTKHVQQPGGRANDSLHHEAARLWGRR